VIVGYHLIWSACACWLPNDPRGSSSHEIRVPALVALAELHHGRKKVQPAGTDIRAFYESAKPLLRHERLLLDDDAIILVGQSIGRTITHRRYSCYACAVMPDHVHVLIRKHRDWAETMIQHFQADGKQALIEACKRPENHPVWGGPGWKVYEDSREDMVRTVGYIEDNPRKIGRPVQVWPFVKPYDGWLPGIPPHMRR
jgi:hypothetical protein